MKACPKCSSSQRVRKKRNFILRLIPSRKYLCNNCNVEYFWVKGLNLNIRIL